MPGLYFRVYSTGQAVFIHRYKIKGKQRVYTLPDSELKRTSTEKQKDRGISAIYDHHDYMKEKRQALDAWSRKLPEVLTRQPDSNVVQLRSA